MRSCHLYHVLYFDGLFVNMMGLLSTVRYMPLNGRRISTYGYWLPEYQIKRSTVLILRWQLWKTLPSGWCFTLKMCRDIMGQIVPLDVIPYVCRQRARTACFYLTSRTAQMQQSWFNLITEAAAKNHLKARESVFTSGIDSATLKAVHRRFESK